MSTSIPPSEKERLEHVAEAKQILKAIGTARENKVLTHAEAKSLDDKLLDLLLCNAHSSETSSQ